MRGRPQVGAKGAAAYRLELRDKLGPELRRGEAHRVAHGLLVGGGAHERAARARREELADGRTHLVALLRAPPVPIHIGAGTREQQMEG